MKFITLLSAIALSSQFVFGQGEQPHGELTEAKINEIITHICASNPAQTQACTSDFTACKALTDPKAKSECVHNAVQKHSTGKPRKHFSICAKVVGPTRPACLQKTRECRKMAKPSAERSKCFGDAFQTYVAIHH